MTLNEIDIIYFTISKINNGHEIYHVKLSEEELLDIIRNKIKQDEDDGRFNSNVAVDYSSFGINKIDIS